jgi:hypothetical protein
VHEAAVLVVDADQVKPGRGAYLHRDPDCLDLAVRRRAVGRALRTTRLDGGQLARLVGPFLPGGSTAVVGQVADTA